MKLAIGKGVSESNKIMVFVPGLAGDLPAL